MTQLIECSIRWKIEEFHRKGTPIGVYDLQIAAIALDNDLILVSNGEKNFLYHLHLVV